MKLHIFSLSKMVVEHWIHDGAEVMGHKIHSSVHTNRRIGVHMEAMCRELWCGGPAQKVLRTKKPIIQNQVNVYLPLGRQMRTQEMTLQNMELSAKGLTSKVWTVSSISVLNAQRKEHLQVSGTLKKKDLNA